MKKGKGSSITKAFKDDTGILKSEKYPDLTTRQEIIFDWIVDYATRNGTMPSMSQVRVNVAFNALAARATILALANRGYLEIDTGTEDRKWKIEGIGPLAPETVARVVFGGVFVGPIRRRLSVDEAKRLGVRIYNIKK